MSDPESLLPPRGFRQRGSVPGGARLVLVRHGECVANARGLAGGPIGDGGLTELGRRQSEALARRLGATGELGDATAFYTSTLPRAMETGAIIFPAINPSLAVTADPSLVELAVGEVDGMTWSEVLAQYPTADWDVDPAQPCAPGGESLLGFYERCVTAIGRLVARHPRERVVLVVHGGVIEQAMKIAGGLPAATRLGLRSENCSITEFDFEDGAWRLLRYNDLSPLV